MQRVHPVLKKEAVIVEDATAQLASAAERALRKHGKEIAEKQFIQKRLAEVAIDLYALAAVLSRTTRAIEQRGEDGARREVDLASGFAILAERRLKSRLDKMERDEDELFKHVAGVTYQDGGYPFDVIG
jgi:acyl-CoA dehydrogenase family protein 9